MQTHSLRMGHPVTSWSAPSPLSDTDTARWATIDTSPTNLDTTRLLLAGAVVGAALALGLLLAIAVYCVFIRWGKVVEIFHWISTERRTATTIGSWRGQTATSGSICTSTPRRAEPIGASHHREKCPAFPLILATTLKRRFPGMKWERFSVLAWPLSAGSRRGAREAHWQPWRTRQLFVFEIRKSMLEDWWRTGIVL